jgi:hypothetical protein
MGEMINSHPILIANLKVRGKLEDVDVGVRTILKWVFKK